MEITIRPLIRPLREDRDGKCHIEICITLKRSRVYIKTGKKIEPIHFEDGRVKKSYGDNAVRLNALISQKIGEYEKAVLDKELAGQIITVEFIKSLSKRVVDQRGFHPYASTVLADMKTIKANSEETQRVYAIRYAKIKAYAPNLSFADVTPQWLTKFHKHLLSREKGNSHNYALGSLKFLMLVFNHAKKAGVISYYPFSDWSIPGETRPERAYLNAKELESLKELLLSGKLDLALQIVLAYFLLECYAGIRNSDWTKFKIETILNEETFYLRTTKTNERITIPLADYPDLKWIVDYIRDNKLAYTFSLQATNKFLKILAILAGIDKKMTTHLGRHTCATRLLELGLTIEEVALVLGVSIKVVSVYAKITGLKLQLAFKRLGLK